MSTNRLAIVVLVVMGLGVLTLAGCGGKVTKSNFDQIKTGMTVAEVEGILGKATDTKSGAVNLPGIAGSGSIMTWKDGEKTIAVTFANGKVALPPVSSGL